MSSLLIADDCTVASLGDLVASLLVGDEMIASLQICDGRLCSGDSDRQESTELSNESGDPSKDEVCAIEAAVTARSIGHGHSKDDPSCVLEFCFFACDPTSGTHGTVLEDLTNKRDTIY
jgi:hypothetical protein